MLDSSFLIAVAAIAFVLAGFVKGVLGQGLPTIAVGLLSLIMSPGEAIALVVVPALLTNIWQARFGPSLVPLIRRLWPTLLASFIGAFVATRAGTGPAHARGRGTRAQGPRHRLVNYGILGLSSVRLYVPPRADPWLGPIFGAGILVLGVYLAFIR
jgi:hypothetical protein